MIGATSSAVTPSRRGRDGLGHQHHVPPGRHRHRDRRLRHPVRHPDHRPHLTGDIAAALRGTPLAARAHGIAAAVGQGQGTRAVAALPAAARQAAEAVTRSAFTAGLNEILVVSGVGALPAAAATTVLIRRKDFVAHVPSRPQPAAPGEPQRAAGRAGR
jgi:hypothetical protein